MYICEDAQFFKKVRISGIFSWWEYLCMLNQPIFYLCNPRTARQLFRTDESEIRPSLQQTSNEFRLH